MHIAERNATRKNVCINSNLPEHKRYLLIVSLNMNSPPILPCNPTEAEDLSDSFVSGDEDNGKSVISNKNINNEINGNWLSSSSNSIHEARLKAKAKRRLRKNSSRDSGRGDSLSDNGDVVKGTSVAPTSPKSKLLDRKSRLGKGRGLPKKGEKLILIDMTV